MLRSTTRLLAAGAAALSASCVLSARMDEPAPPAPPAQGAMRDRMTALVKTAQRQLVQGLEEVDGGSKFLWDEWEREDGSGGGTSCVLQDSEVFEKAGVNVSVVTGTLNPAACRAMCARGKDLDPESSPKYFACGVSIVIHPHSPLVPTMHANYRYFEVEGRDGKTVAWWGGGSDLTPAYVDEADARHFHDVLAATCTAHGVSPEELNEACKDYFYLPHRKEHRGVGGIFFDDWEADSPAGAEKIVAFVADAAAALGPSYLPIVANRKALPYTPAQKEWQQLRRGRYVEFNLIHDRGTKFGLAMPTARTESILMSLPLTARWEYMHEPAEGSPEARSLATLRSPPASWFRTGPREGLGDLPALGAWIELMRTRGHPDFEKAYPAP